MSYQSPSVESVVDAGALVLAGTGASPGSGEANREPDDLGIQQADHIQDRGRHGPGEVTPPSSPAEHRNAAGKKAQENGQRDYSYRSPSPSGASSVTNSTSATHRSNGSNGSGSTITRRAHPRRGGERPRNGEGRLSDTTQEDYDVETTPKPLQTPYFEPDGGEAPYRGSRRSLDQPRAWRLANMTNHKAAASKSVSSPGSSISSDIFSEMSLVPSNEGTLSSPDRSEAADSPNSRFFPHGPCPPAPVPPQQQQQRDPFMYMVPGMPYGGQPGQGQQSQPPPQQALTFYEQFPQPPRPEKLPATGYELLASRLSVGETGGATIPPMYRRFESLNHRLLLHLQDELMELEEQLHQLDAVDTQNRRAHHGFHPASRRQEAMAMAAGELPWFKTDILGKIGFKLNQYNQVLTSFKQTQELPSPEFSDIDMYRDYLATHNPVVESESHFLDMDDDLVTLCRPGFAHAGAGLNNEDLLTPMPRKAIAFPPTPTSPLSEVGSRGSAQRGRARPNAQKQEKPSGSIDVPMLAGTVAAAFLLPILSFVVIPALVGRLAVVFLMSVATAVALLQTGLARQAGPNGDVGMGSATNVIVCAGVYGAVMAVVAAIV